MMLEKGEEAVDVSQCVQMEGKTSATLARPLVDGQPRECIETQQNRAAGGREGCGVCVCVCVCACVHSPKSLLGTVCDCFLGDVEMKRNLQESKAQTHT